MKTKSLIAAIGLSLTLSPELAAAAAPVWQGDVAAAFAAARRSSKPLLVDLFADWCGWCRVMEQRVFPDPAFRAYAEGFVLLRVDVEDGGEGSELAARYDSSALPSLLLLEPSGAQIGLVQGFAEAADLVDRLRAEQALHARRLEGFAATLAASEPSQLERAAFDFYRRNDGERATALFQRLLAVATPAGERGTWTRYFLADSLRLARRFEEARAAAERLRRDAERSADAELAERVALLPFWISRDAHRCADASGVLTRFAVEHPRSVLLPGARNAFERLRGTSEVCS